MENKANQQSESTKERPQSTDRNENQKIRNIRIIEEITKKYNLENNPIKSCIEEPKQEITAIAHKIQWYTARFETYHQNKMFDGIKEDSMGIFLTEIANGQMKCPIRKKPQHFGATYGVKQNNTMKMQNECQE